MAQISPFLPSFVLYIWIFSKDFIAQKKEGKEGKGRDPGSIPFHTSYLDWNFRKTLTSSSIMCLHSNLRRSRN